MTFVNDVTLIFLCPYGLVHFKRVKLNLLKKGEILNKTLFEMFSFNAYLYSIHLQF